jgi:hypothetical protein
LIQTFLILNQLHIVRHIPNNMMEMATLNHYSGQEQTPYLFQVANKFQQSARVMP